MKRLSTVLLFLMIILTLATSMVYAQPKSEEIGETVILKDKEYHKEGYLVPTENSATSIPVLYVCESKIFIHLIKGHKYVEGLSYIDLTDTIERINVAAYLYEDNKVIDVALDAQENASAAIAQNEIKPYYEDKSYKEVGYYSMKHEGKLYNDKTTAYLRD